MIEDWVVGLLDNAADALIECGSGPACVKVLAPGAEVTFDWCACEGDCGGQVWVRPDVSFPYSSFPIQEVDPTCAVGWAWQVEVGVGRCTPVGSDDGGPPPLEDLADATLNLLLDARALKLAVSRTGGLSVMATWTPIGPVGGCVGGFWTLVVDPHGR